MNKRVIEWIEPRLSRNAMNCPRIPRVTFQEILTERLLPTHRRRVVVKLFPEILSMAENVYGRPLPGFGWLEVFSHISVFFSTNKIPLQNIMHSLLANGEVNFNELSCAMRNFPQVSGWSLSCRTVTPLKANLDHLWTSIILPFVVVLWQDFLPLSLSLSP